MSTSINPIGTGTTPDTSGVTGQAQAASGLTKTANMNTFLQLLVAQLKNQDPLQPTDGTQFVSQLAQFSALEQEIGINTNTQNMSQELQQLIATQTVTSTGDGTGNGSGNTTGA